MINFCQISPTPHLNDFCADNNVHLILAHLVETDPVYAEWYKSRPELKILDNSAFEMYKQGREMYPASQLLEMGQRVQANVIVMSDYPNQPAKVTIDAAETLGPEFKRNGFQTFFVPQSKIGDIDDYLYACEYAASSDLVDFVGISILGVPNAFGNIEKDNKLQRFLSRWKMMHILRERGTLQRLIDNGKKIHFLGALDGWAGEVQLVKEFRDYIFSWDSSQCVWHGLNNVVFDNSPTGLINGKFEEEVDFKFHTNDSNMIDNVLYNIDVLHGAARC